MEVVKNPLREKIGKHIKKITGEPEEGFSEDSNKERKSVEVEEEEDGTQEAVKERQEKIRMMQARRRSERANFREEMRRKHKLKSCEEDRQLALCLPDLLRLQDQEEEEGVVKVAHSVISIMKESWTKIKTSIAEE